jgi:hypothetical protein
VDPVPDPLLLRKSGSAGLEPGASGLAARNSDHETTEAVSGTQNTGQKLHVLKDLILPTFVKKKLKPKIFFNNVLLK